MKKQSLLIIMLLGIFFCTFSSCGESEVGGENEETNENNEIPEKLNIGEIRMKVYPSDKKVSFHVLAKKISIDWGDGVTDEFTMNEEIKNCSHDYVNNNLRTIIIHTEELRGIGKAVIEMSGNYTEIHFGECPFLEEISFPNLGLTVLEIEKSDQLRYLDCSNNNLSASALNSLFESLPDVSEGWINFKENNGTGACDINIVEEKGWVDEIKPDEFFIEENIQILVEATYNSFIGFLKAHYHFEGLYSNTINLDNHQSGNSIFYKDIYNHNINPNNSFVGDLYGESYKAIRSINILLSGLKKFEDERLSQTIHSFSIMRAYIYFTMINYWGDVVMPDENYDINQIFEYRRIPVEQALSIIMEDMLEAEKRLPADEHNEIFGFSKSFAQLMLARIYSCQGNYSKALEYANKIINSGKYSLSSNPAGAFEDYMNRELITKFIDTYENEVVSGQNDERAAMIKKGTYMPLARYPEVLLLASECYLKNNDTQSAANMLNILRGRNSRPTISTNNISEIENAILSEYKEDLGKEGLYFFALKRFGKAESVLGIEPFRKLLPIPAREVLLSSLIYQNEGY